MFGACLEKVAYFLVLASSKFFLGVLGWEIYWETFLSSLFGRSWHGQVRTAENRVRANRV
jgi:hypothetical protein